MQKKTAFRWTSGAMALILAAVFLAGCGRDPLPPQTAPVETPVCSVPETVPQSAVETEAAPPTETQPEQKRRYVLTFVGDCTLGSDVNVCYAPSGFVKTVGQDYGYPFRNVVQWFREDDLTFANLEGPLTEEGSPSGYRYSFRGPTDFVRILTENSVDAVTLANNHALDYGQKGYDSTRSVLTQAGVPFVEKDGTCIVTLEGGLTVGFYATTYSSVDADAMTDSIRQMKEQGVDLVIYAPHWGVEGSYRPHPEQQALGYAAIDAGADIVCGSHPHVLQPVEAYGEGLIYYSLGNFSFGGNAGPRDLDTAMIRQEVLVDGEGTVSLGEWTAIPCSVSSVPRLNNYQPTPYPEGSEEYLRVMEKLTGTFTGRDLPIG